MPVEGEAVGGGFPNSKRWCSEKSLISGSLFRLVVVREKRGRRGGGTSRLAILSHSTVKESQRFGLVIVSPQKAGA